VVGEIDERLQNLLAATLADAGADILATGSGDRPDLVLVMLDRFETVDAVVHARVRGRGAPVIALLPLTDPVWAHGAMIAGAVDCWALDRPMEELKDAIIKRIGYHARRGR
jgi:hypothetical protein